MIRRTVNLFHSQKRAMLCSPTYIVGARGYGKAAKQGLENAEYNLGSMYERGAGFPIDTRRASLWYGKAALKGLETAAKAFRRLKAASQQK